MILDQLESSTPRVPEVSAGERWQRGPPKVPRDVCEASRGSAGPPKAPRNERETHGGSAGECVAAFLST